MWIVQLALRRPYTFVVMALLILLMGSYSIRVTPKDIFPSIDTPVVTVLWQYSGLSADDDLPVGLQIMAPAMADDRLYRVGAAYEAARGPLPTAV